MVISGSDGKFGSDGKYIKDKQYKDEIKRIAQKCKWQRRVPTRDLKCLAASHPGPLALSSSGSLSRPALTLSWPLALSLLSLSPFLSLSASLLMTREPS